MEYFKDRISNIKNISKDNEDSDQVIKKLIDLIEDMALMLDDAVDAINELEERIIELEVENER